MLRIHKSRWLGHKYIFHHCAIEKSIVDFLLLNELMVGYRNWQNIVDDCGFYNRTECLSIISAWRLMKSFGNKTSFEVINFPIRSLLKSNNPLTQQTILTFEGEGTSYHVRFWRRAEFSSSIACFHKEILRALSTDLAQEVQTVEEEDVSGTGVLILILNNLNILETVHIDLETFPCICQNLKEEIGEICF